jgi:hypothetical protein
VAVEAGKFEGEMLYDPSDGFLIALVQLTRGSDPELALCTFAKATNGNTKYTGSSFFGRVSELENLGKLPRERFARCELSRIK